MTKPNLRIRAVTGIVIAILLSAPVWVVVLWWVV